MRRRSLPQLGETERAILARLWSHGPADVKAMQKAIGDGRGIKLNTVQSTLDRLYRKGLADRQKAGRAYVYRASVSQREWLLQTLEALVGDLFRDGPDLVLSAFVDLAERTGAEQLEELERVVRSRRGRSEEGES